MIDEARWWSWRRQRLDRTARGIDDALRSVIAITSAHPSAPLALLARVPRMLQGMYEGSTRAKTAIRLPAMRKAVWLLATDTAQIPFHACRGTGVVERNLLRRVGIGPDRWNELREKVLTLCATPMQARDIKDASGEDSELIQAVLTVLAATGEVVRHRAPSLTSNAFTFISTEAWLGRPLPPMPVEDALPFLAGDYLQAYGPATIDDFAWWTGLPHLRCEEALMTHEPVRLDGELLLWPAHERAFAQFRPVANRVNLLPAWDPYPMGYLDRSRLGEQAAIDEVFDKTGASLPIVLIEGRIGGRWDLHLTKGGALTVTVTLFESPGARVWEAIEAEAGAIGTLFQARDVKVLRAEPVRLRRRPIAGVAGGSLEAQSTRGNSPGSATTRMRASQTPASRTRTARAKTARKASRVKGIKKATRKGASPKSARVGSGSRKATPRKGVSPKSARVGSGSRKAAPRKATPRKATPRKSTPRKATPAKRARVNTSRNSGSVPPPTSRKPRRQSRPKR